MTSARSDRGAVHILVLVITLVIGLIGWVLWYQTFSENEGLKKSEAQAKTDATNSFSDYDAVKRAYDDLAQMVGGLQPMATPGEEDRDPDTWKRKYSAWHKPVGTKITEELNVFGGDKSISTLLGAFVPAETKLNQLQSELDTTKRALATALADADTARRANTSLAEGHNTAMAEANTNLVSTRERLEGQLSQSESKNEETSKNLNRVSNEFNEAVAKAGEEKRKLLASFESHDREVTVLKSYLNIDRVREAPDGRVIEVDAKTGLCWVDLGSHHALRRGTRFKTYGLNKGNVRDEHGTIVVHDIGPDRSLCSIEHGAPIKAGDYITNPYFDRQGRKIFYFLGNMPGRFDNQTAKNILEDFGASVTDKMSVHVDFIILGDDPNPEITPDNMNPEWFKDRPEYNDAVRWGIETIRARDLETYLQF